MSDASGSSPIGKALGLLDQVAAFGRPVRFADLLAVCAMPKATLARLLQKLVSEGMLGYDPDRRVYLMGTRLVRLAHAAWRDFSIAPLAHPHLMALARQIGEAVYLSKLDYGQCVCLERGTPDDLAPVFSEINRVYPAYCTAVGKAMLAHLPQGAQDQSLAQQSFHRMTDTTITDAAALRTDIEIILEHGYAIENEEHMRGIIAVAVPILSPGGTLIGGLGVHASDRRTDFEMLKAKIPHMKDTAAAIVRDAADLRPPEMLA